MSSELGSARFWVPSVQSLVWATALASPVASVAFRSSSVILRRKALRLRRDRGRVRPQYSFLRRMSIFDRNAPSHRVLEGIELFRDLAQEEYEKIADYVRARISFLRVRPGQVIFR